MIRKKKGFTLIELLVVIATLVVLAVIVGGLGVCKPQSRWVSRLTGKTLELKLLDNFSKMISVSITCNGKKNVTYIDTEGYYRTKEFTDTGWLQGEILWTTPKKAE